MPGTLRPSPAHDLLAAPRAESTPGPSSADLADHATLFSPRPPAASFSALPARVSALPVDVSAPLASVSAPPAPALSAASEPMLCPKCQMRYPAAFVVCPRDAAELAMDHAEVVRDEIVGTTLADTYDVVRVIGEGGMGRVYEARHVRLRSKRFAIKMLHPEYLRQPDVLTRFQREAEAAAAVQSPFVMDVYDVGRTPDGRPFIVGEYLDGKELAVYLGEVGKMPVGPAVRIVRQVVRALAAAHLEGVVHRDVKPENIFLVGDLASPSVKVLDFGISKIAEQPGTALTKTGMVMGTPSYMAPEQARGEHVDHRADIYAVGAVLYAALTGRRPFDRGDPTATLMAVLTQEPVRPRALEASIPEALELVIQRAMARQADDRHATMMQLDAELAPFDPGAGRLSRDGTSGPPGALFAAPAMGGAPLDRHSRDIGRARPWIALFSAVGLFWAAAILVLAMGAVLRFVHGGGTGDDLTLTEAVLLVIAVVIGLATPAVLGVRHLAEKVWGNTARAVDVAARVRGPVLLSLAAYGLGSLLIRGVESVLLRRAIGVAWPGWDLVLLLVGAVAAAGAAVVAEAEGRRA